jgi:hypothetical protein
MGWLLLAWLAIDLLPFQLYRKMMRPSVRKPEMGDDAAAAFSKRVGWAVRAVARRVPWRAVCFHQGIAAQQMLCRAGVSAELHYGVAKSVDKRFEAHVWVTSHGQTVVGGETQDRFTVLAIFAGGGSSTTDTDLNAEETLPPR